MKRFFQFVAVNLTFALIFAQWSFSSVCASPDVSAEAAALIAADTGLLLSEKDAFTPRPIASTTKIMTAWLALEYPHLDEWFVVDEASIRVEGSSMGLQPGDQVTMRALVYGMLLSSGNDAANAAAVKLAGSVEAFVKRMNQRAEEIGMKQTHFATPSGLDQGQEHYSSAYDMALLAKNALENPDFLAICSTSSQQVEYGNPPYKRWLKNHNRMLREYSGAIGVKTGFTKKAGRCLVAAAQRDGVRLISVVLHAPSDWSDSRALLDYGFGAVESVALDVDFSYVVFEAVGGEEDRGSVAVQQAPQIVLPLGKKELLSRKIYLKPFYYAPIAEGEELGYVTYYVQDEIVYQMPLYAGKEISKLEPKRLFGLF